MHHSEEKVAAIQTRQGADKSLQQKTEVVKKGLIKLMHNVVLLRDSSSPDIFTPVRL